MKNMSIGILIGKHHKAPLIAHIKTVPIKRKVKIPIQNPDKR